VVDRRGRVPEPLEIDTALDLGPPGARNPPETVGVAEDVAAAIDENEVGAHAFDPREIGGEECLVVAVQNERGASGERLQEIPPVALGKPESVPITEAVVEGGRDKQGERTGGRDRGAGEPWSALEPPPEARARPQGQDRYARNQERADLREMLGVGRDADERDEGGGEGVRRRGERKERRAPPARDHRSERRERGANGPPA